MTDARDSTLPERNPDRYPGAPAWVKRFGAVLLALVLLFLLLKATGLGGEHGPRRHQSSGTGGSHVPPPPAGHQQ